MGAKRAEQGIEIDAPPEEVFAAVTDYETFPDWQSAVRECEVIERDAEGRGEVVAFAIDANVKEVRYRLRYRYQHPHRIGWDYLEGDVKSVDGSLDLDALDGGRTRATYRLEIDPGVFLPGPLRRVLVDQVMRGFVRELKARVEGG